MALPNTNISVAMVKAELGASTNDVGQLCIHPNINMWSKRKPVRDGRVGLIPLEEVGMYDNCGLTLHPFTGDDTKLTKYNKPGTWVDNTGQHITPFRLGDFRGYQKEFRNRPVELNSNSKPDKLLRKQTAISVTSVAQPIVPVVTLADFPNDLRIGVVIFGRTYTHEEGVFVGCASALNQTDDYVVANLTDVEWLYLDVKFCLIGGYVPWTTTMPTGRIMYEIPREFPGENANWINVPLDTPAEGIKTFEIAGFVDAQQVQYIIEAYTGSTGRIALVPDAGPEIQITMINLPANTRVSATANNRPLQVGMAYTAYLYLGASETPVAERPMTIN